MKHLRLIIKLSFLPLLLLLLSTSVTFAACGIKAEYNGGTMCLIDGVYVDGMVMCSNSDTCCLSETECAAGLPPVAQSCSSERQCGPNERCNLTYHRCEPSPYACDNDQDCAQGSVCDPISHSCNDPDIGSGGSIGKPPIDIDVGPTNETFDAVNPLKFFGPFGEDLSTPGGIASRILQFAFPIAGLILFVMIVWGGFEILAGAQEKKSLDSGKQRVTAAIVGFLLLFSSYWIAQIIEFIFGITIL